MKHFFVDISALIALAKANDSYHDRARDFLLGLSPPFSFVTTDYILDETVTRIRDSLGAEKATLFCRKIFESRLYKIIFVDRRLFFAGLEKLEKYADKTLSFTDAVSFVVMEKQRLQTAFAFDDDFKRAGFEMAP